MFRYSFGHEQLRQALEDIVRPKVSACSYGQTLPGVLIDHCKHSHSLPVMCPGQYEVIGPDMVAVSRPQPEARPIIEPQPSPLGLLLRYFQPFPSPDPLPPEGRIDLPAITPEQSGYPAVSVPSVLAG